MCHPDHIFERLWLSANLLYISCVCQQMAGSSHPESQQSPLQGHAINWDAASFSQMHDPSIRHSHHDMGSAGATTSFGGGSSFGGGGGGSSW